jgi:hypothetical protein
MIPPTDKINISFSWPCYACMYNNRKDTDEPCSICIDNVNSVGAKDSSFDPISDPK